MIRIFCASPHSTRHYLPPEISSICVGSRSTAAILISITSKSSHCVVVQRLLVYFVGLWLVDTVESMTLSCVSLYCHDVNFNLSSLISNPVKMALSYWLNFFLPIKYKKTILLLKRAFILYKTTFLLKISGI